jgi:cobalamin-dependent methionine synthase I
MFVIANNITTRSPEIDRIFQQLKAASYDPQQEAAKTLQALGKRCADAGANAIEINIQQHHDRPEVMESTVKLIQQVTDKQLCLSANNAEALEAGLKACQRFPIVNYISIEEARLKEMLPLAAKHGAEVVLLASDASAPDDAREMVAKTAVLVGAANESGIPNDHIFVDPGLIHITSDIGQRHTLEVKEFLKALPDAVDPPVKSTCWIGNISAGAPERLRPILESTMLSVLAGLGLSAVFLNVLKPETMRSARLIKIFNNEVVYSDADAEL